MSDFISSINVCVEFLKQRNLDSAINHFDVISVDEGDYYNKLCLRRVIYDILDFCKDNGMSRFTDFLATLVLLVKKSSETTIIILVSFLVHFFIKLKAFPKLLKCAWNGIFRVLRLWIQLYFIFMLVPAAKDNVPFLYEGTVWIGRIINGFLQLTVTFLFSLGSHVWPDEAFIACGKLFNEFITWGQGLI